MAPSGAIISDASVLVEPENAGASHALHTDNEVRYRIAGLAAGEYKVTGEEAGFQAAVKQAVISGSERIVIDPCIHSRLIAQALLVFGCTQRRHRLKSGAVCQFESNGLHRFDPSCPATSRYRQDGEDNWRRRTRRCQLTHARTHSETSLHFSR